MLPPAIWHAAALLMNDMIKGWRCSSAGDQGAQGKNEQVHSDRQRNAKNGQRGSDFWRGPQETLSSSQPSPPPPRGSGRSIARLSLSIDHDPVYFIGKEDVHLRWFRAACMTWMQVSWYCKSRTWWCSCRSPDPQATQGHVGVAIGRPCDIYFFAAGSEGSGPWPDKDGSCAESTISSGSAGPGKEGDARSSSPRKTKHELGTWLNLCVSEKGVPRAIKLPKAIGVRRGSRGSGDLIPAKAAMADAMGETEAGHPYGSTLLMSSLTDKCRESGDAA